MILMLRKRFVDATKKIDFSEVSKNLASSENNFVGPSK